MKFFGLRNSDLARGQSAFQKIWQIFDSFVSKLEKAEKHLVKLERKRKLEEKRTKHE